jgi:large subunit ribosomal protein L29
VKISELRQMPIEDLQHKRDQLVQEYFGLRIKHSLGQLEDPLVLRRIRRDIARAKTLLTQRGVQEVVRRRRHTTAASRPAATEKAAAERPEKAAKREKRGAEKAAKREERGAEKAAAKGTAKSRPAQAKKGKAGKFSSSERGKG